VRQDRQRWFPRIPRAVRLFLALAACVAVVPLLLRPVIVDVAPFAAVEVLDGPSINANVELAELSSVRAVNDGLWKPTHQFVFPEGAVGLRFRLPAEFAIQSVNLFATEVGRDRLVAVRLMDSLGRVTKTLQSGWQGQTYAATTTLSSTGAKATTVVVSFLNGPAPRINAVALLVMQDRWSAWGGVFAMTLGIPIVAGFVFLNGVIGMGSLFAGRTQCPAKAAAVGVFASLLIAVGWMLAPRSTTADAVFFSFSSLAAVYGIRSTVVPPELRRLAVAAMMLLLAFTQAESLAMSDDRAEPLDFMHAYYGADRLGHCERIPANLSARPWLMQFIAAPWLHAAGRFDYWCYVGLMAGLNGLTLLPVHVVANRLGFSNRSALCAWFALLPGFANYHFMGQRLLGAAFAMAAATLLLDAFRGRGKRGDAPFAGLFFILGIGFHPSVAFVLVTSATLWLPSLRTNWKAAVAGFGIPAVGYAGWLATMSTMYPGRRNDLLMYPLMNSLNETFPAGMSFLDAARSLTAAEWERLVTNRVVHLRHYLWTDNWTPAAWTWGRWISLPNVVCWAGIPLFLLCRVWRGRAEWCLWTIVAPLLFHHAFIGQAHPQFHIGPEPFLAIMGLAAAALAERNGDRSWLIPILKWLVVVEVAVRFLWPLAAAKASWDRLDLLMKWFRLTADDPVLPMIFAALPAIALLNVARRIVFSRAECGDRSYNPPSAEVGSDHS
jgi:hypothetical protein